jgi:hypothetical protein
MQSSPPGTYETPLYKMQWWKAALIILAFAGVWASFHFLVQFAKPVPVKLRRACLRTCRQCRKESYVWDRSWTRMKVEYSNSDRVDYERAHKACLERLEGLRKEARARERMVAEAKSEAKQRLAIRAGSLRFLMSSRDTAPLDDLTMALATATEQGLTLPELKLHALVHAYKHHMQEAWFGYNRDGSPRDKLVHTAAVNSIGGSCTASRVVAQHRVNW